MPHVLSNSRTWNVTSSPWISPSRYCCHKMHTQDFEILKFLMPQLSQTRRRSIFTSLCLSLSLCDVVPGHKQGSQQAAWIHSGYQDTQPPGWQRRWHVPHHWNTGGCQQQSIFVKRPAPVFIYYSTHLQAALFYFVSPVSYCSVASLHGTAAVQRIPSK